MNANNQADILDEALKLYFLESAHTGETALHPELPSILAGEPVVVMSEAMRIKLIDELQDVLQQSSFGQLITHAIDEQKIDKVSLAEETGLPQTLLMELQRDEVFTNNVPIIFFKKLLETLNISFQIADKAIRNTYELLQHRVSSTASYEAVAPAFKKGGSLPSRESFLKNRSKTSTGGKELFQNKEALDRYLNRLDELMKNR